MSDGHLTIAQQAGNGDRWHVTPVSGDTHDLEDVLNQLPDTARDVTVHLQMGGAIIVWQELLRPSAP